MSYTESQLRFLAKKDPKELIRILNNPSEDARAITFGVEVLGEEIIDEDITFPIFINLLQHKHALIREGALNGVFSFYFNKNPPTEILKLINNIAYNDLSLDNREMAREFIDKVHL